MSTILQYVPYLKYCHLSLLDSHQVNVCCSYVTVSLISTADALITCNCLIKDQMPSIQEIQVVNQAVQQ